MEERSRQNLKLDAEAPRRGLVGGIANETVLLGNDVGETVTGIDTQVDGIEEGVAELCGGTVLKAVHGFAARQVG